ncbi:hypothetical protein AC1031_012374 [Aphanomyces cochlioides]|nr:hypothetical protein AC1031_012374 [Aphanomyces cochlioides]
MRLWALVSKASLQVKTIKRNDATMFPFGFWSNWLQLQEERPEITQRLWIQIPTLCLKLVSETAVTQPKDGSGDSGHQGKLGWFGFWWHRQVGAISPPMQPPSSRSQLVVNRFTDGSPPADAMTAKSSELPIPFGRNPGV